MRPLTLVLLLTACWGAAKHAMRAHGVAAEMRPTCHDFTTHEQPDRASASPEDDGWLWWVDACGEWLWCRYDERGLMRCHDEPSPSVTTAALFHAKCGGPVTGHYGRDGFWQLEVCNKRLECARLEQQWQCRDR